MARTATRPASTPTNKRTRRKAPKPIPRRESVLAAIRSKDAELKSMGVKSLAVFGSVARNEATRKSDIDILVEFSKPVGLFDISHVKFYLEDLLGARVDLVMREALKPQLRDRILGEAVYAS